MLSKFKIILVFLTFVLFLTPKSLLAEEKKLKVEKFKDWGLQCPTKNNCEVIQSLKVNETDLKFNFIFGNFLNKDKKKKEIFSIVTPLGVNVQKSLLFKFIKIEKRLVGKETKENITVLDVYQLPFLKCEVIGCIVSVNNDTNNKKQKELFALIKKGMTEKNNFQIIIQGFGRPFIVNSSLAGFGAAVKEMEKRNKS